MILMQDLTSEDEKKLIQELWDGAIASLADTDQAMPQVRTSVSLPACYLAPSLSLSVHCLH